MTQGEFFDASHAKPGDELPDMPSVQSERSRRGLKDFTIPKLYSSISEVSALTGIEQYVLRYWETEFDELRPHKNRAGNRIYSQKDVKLVTRIKELLRDERYTIEGAKQIIKQEIESEKRSKLAEAKPVVDEAQLPIIPPPAPTEVSIPIAELHDIRKSLLALRERLAYSK
ncbi:MAG: MerR family transcriptional regulator [Candidatus Kapaibacterium sp.]